MDRIDQVLENQAKLEIKIDQLMRLAIGVLTKSGIEFDLSALEGYVCPLCRQPTKFQVRVDTRGVERVCACGTGLIPPLDPQQHIAPVPKERKKDELREERLESLEEGLADLEDGAAARRR